MQKGYILPVVGQIYKNRNGREYCCLSNADYASQSNMRAAVSHGEHRATMVRMSDGWSIVVHGLQQYEDGTVEWNFSTDGAFREDHLDRCRKLQREKDPNMKKYFDYLDQLCDSGVTNMFGAVAYLKNKFFELYVDEARAREVLAVWMDSRSGR